MGMMSQGARGRSKNYLGSGVYGCAPVSVAVTGDIDAPVYTFTYRPDTDIDSKGSDEDGASEGLSVKGYNKHDALSLPDIKHRLDTGDPTQAGYLELLVGEPYFEGRKLMGWRGCEDKPVPVLKWNGLTGDKAKLVGRLEVTIKSRPASGNFPARYDVTDFDREGAGAEMAEEAQRLAWERKHGKVEETTPPTPHAAPEASQTAPRGRSKATAG